MARKTVSISPKPGSKPQPANMDAWVKHRGDDPMKRLTIDVPQSLHTRIKTVCASRGKKMADEIRELLEQHFPENRDS